MWRIIGKYRGKSEVIDRTNTRADAEYLVREYQMAYGSAWQITMVMPEWWRHLEAQTLKAHGIGTQYPDS